MDENNREQLLARAADAVAHATSDVTRARLRAGDEGEAQATVHDLVEVVRDLHEALSAR